MSPFVQFTRSDGRPILVNVRRIVVAEQDPGDETRTLIVVQDHGRYLLTENLSTVKAGIYHALYRE